jgi:hypothetical protein
MQSSKPVKKACIPLLVLSVTALGFGCSGIPIRPDGSPGYQPCPAGALEAMQRLGITVADSAFITIDPQRANDLPFTLYDGPIESVLTRDFGPLPAGTRILGTVWTGGLDVVIRYHEARLPSGVVMPFCGVARDAYGGMTKRPSSPAGLGIIPDSGAAVWIVDAFR